MTRLTIRPCSIPDVLEITPHRFLDDRGFFVEHFNASVFNEALGLSVEFVQDNISVSKKNVLRGIHYQINTPQSKLISVLQGEILDIAVDLRRQSKTFGQYTQCILSATKGNQLWIPKGFGHAFLSLSETSLVHYKVDHVRVMDNERCILWKDPDIDITWPTLTPILSDKDQSAGTLLMADVFA